MTAVVSLPHKHTCKVAILVIFFIVLFYVCMHINAVTTDSITSYKFVNEFTTSENWVTRDSVGGW